MLCIICNVINLKPETFLEEYKHSRLQSYSYEFSETLSSARKVLSLSKVEAAQKCNLSAKRYEKIESGNVSVYGSELSLISVALHVPYSCLEDLSDKAGTFRKVSTTKVKKKKLYDLFAILSEYKYIDTEKEKIESHTLIVLLLLILHNEDGRYEADILYYLNNIYEPGNLALKLHNPFDKGFSETEILDRVRALQGYTYASLASRIGISSSALFEFLTGVSRPFLRNCIAVSDVLDVSVTLGLEHMVKSFEPKEGMTEVVDVFATINSSIEWTYHEDRTFASETISKMLEIILSNEDTITKYELIENLGI